MKSKFMRWISTKNEQFWQFAQFGQKGPCRTSGQCSGRVWAVFGQCATPHLLLLFWGGFGHNFRAVFGQFSLNFGWFLGGFWAKKDRLDCPIGHCKLLIYRFITFINLLILLFVKEEILL